MEPSLYLLENILHYILYEDSDDHNIPFTEERIQDIFHGCTYEEFLNACKHLQLKGCITYTETFGTVLIKEILFDCENTYIALHRRNLE